MADEKKPGEVVATEIQNAAPQQAGNKPQTTTMIADLSGSAAVGDLKQTREGLLAQLFAAQAKRQSTVALASDAVASGIDAEIESLQTQVGIVEQEISRLEKEQERDVARSVTGPPARCGAVHSVDEALSAFRIAISEAIKESETWPSKLTVEGREACLNGTRLRLQAIEAELAANALLEWTEGQKHAAAKAEADLAKSREEQAALNARTEKLARSTANATWVAALAAIGAIVVAVVQVVIAAASK